MKKKVLIIGLDGFTWRIGKRMIREGLMPTLGRLVEQGVHGDLSSVVPSETSPAWSSFQTGCLPGKTGIFAFHGFLRQTRDIKLNSYQEIKVPTLWEILSAAGQKAVSINMPMTSPPPHINGAIIPGLTCPELSASTVYPPELFDRYIRLDPDYMIVNNELSLTLVDGVRQAVKTEEARCRLALNLMREIEWDVFSLQIQSTDVFQHRYWWAVDPDAEGFSQGDYDQAAEFYKHIDGIMGRLIDAAGQSVLTVIVSDHGFCRKKAEIGINSWLMQNGYLCLKPPKKTPLQTFKEKVKSAFPPAKHIARICGNIEKKLFSSQGEERRKKISLYSETVVKHIRETIDYEHTFAFCLGGMAGLLYLTDKMQKDKAAEMLKKLLDAYGPASRDPLIAEIQPVEQFCQTEDTNYPDYVIIFSHGAGARINPVGDIVESGIADGKRSGIHEQEGIFVLHGPDVKSGLAFDANLIDITPTILSVLSIPVPRHIDGKSLTEVFTVPLEITYSDTESTSKENAEYSSQEQNWVEKQLKDLGYL